jgi:hypothetical protein
MRTLNRNHAAFIAFGEANAARLKDGPSVDSAERFILALKRIDMSGTSARFRAAFMLYVGGMDEGISRLKAGKEIGDSNNKVKSGYNELLVISRQSGFEWLSSFDVPMAIMLALSGGFFLGIRKQQAAARLERVKKGELTEEFARKRNRDLSLAGYTLIFAGLGIAVSHYLSN